MHSGCLTLHIHALPLAEQSLGESVTATSLSTTSTPGWSECHAVPTYSARFQVCQHLLLKARLSQGLSVSCCTIVCLSPFFFLRVESPLGLLWHVFSNLFHVHLILHFTATSRHILECSKYLLADITAPCRHVFGNLRPIQQGTALMYDYKCLTAPVCENTFDSRSVFVVCRWLSMWTSSWATHGLPCRAPVYRGCPCRDPLVCHRVQDDSVAKRQTFFVWWLVLLES